MKVSQEMFDTAKKISVLSCPHALRPDIEPPPRFMQELPIDKRGYPIPWFVDYLNGEPEFRAMDPRKFRRAINERLCWTCGNKLFGEEIFVIGPMCAVSRISSEPPNHRECGIYAAKNCPFLSKPQMHRRTDEEIDKIKVPSPGIMIERNPGVSLLWYTRRHALLTVRNCPPAVDGILFKLGWPFKLEWYCRGRTATRAEILESLESGLPILRDQAEKFDGPAGVAFLEKQITDTYRLIPPPQ
jgi:hypothetical protein